MRVLLELLAAAVIGGVAGLIVAVVVMTKIKVKEGREDTTVAFVAGAAGAVIVTMIYNLI